MHVLHGTSFHFQIGHLNFQEVDAATLQQTICGWKVETQNLASLLPHSQTDHSLLTPLFSKLLQLGKEPVKLVVEC